MSEALKCRSFSRIMILALLFISACASKNDANQRQSAIYFAAGTESLMQQQYTEALNSLIKANQLDPENSDILNNLGMAYYFKGETHLALKHLKRSVEINPDNSDAKVNIASIHYKQGDFKTAEKLYKEVTKDLTYEKQARTFYNLGMLEMERKNNPVAAEDYFRRSLKEDENYCPSYYQIGLIQLKRRQLNTALKSFKEASMGTCYNAPAPHYYQAATLVELNRFEEARIKLDDVETRFKKSVFASKARAKNVEINQREKIQKTQDTHASRKMFESPEF